MVTSLISAAASQISCRHVNERRRQAAVAATAHRLPIPSWRMAPLQSTPLLTDSLRALPLGAVGRKAAARGGAAAVQSARTCIVCSALLDAPPKRAGCSRWTGWAAGARKAGVAERAGGCRGCRRVPTNCSGRTRARERGCGPGAHHLVARLEARNCICHWSAAPCPLALFPGGPHSVGEPADPPLPAPPPAPPLQCTAARATQAPPNRCQSTLGRSRFLSAADTASRCECPTMQSLLQPAEAPGGRRGGPPREAPQLEGMPQAGVGPLGPSAPWRRCPPACRRCLPPLPEGCCSHPVCPLAAGGVTAGDCSSPAQLGAGQQPAEPIPAGTTSSPHRHVRRIGSGPLV